MVLDEYGVNKKSEAIMTSLSNILIQLTSPTR